MTASTCDKACSVAPSACSSAAPFFSTLSKTPLFLQPLSPLDDAHAPDDGGVPLPSPFETLGHPVLVQIPEISGSVVRWHVETASSREGEPFDNVLQRRVVGKMVTEVTGRTEKGGRERRLLLGWAKAGKDSKGRNKATRSEGDDLGDSAARTLMHHGVMVLTFCINSTRGRGGRESPCWIRALGHGGRGRGGRG